VQRIDRASNELTPAATSGFPFFRVALHNRSSSRDQPKTSQHPISQKQIHTMTHSSISFEGDGTSMVSEIDLAPPSTSTNFLYQCLSAFNEWISSLDSFEERFQGNLVAVPEIDAESGLIRVGKTVIVPEYRSPASDTVYLGGRGMKDRLVHGSVVALFAKGSAQNAFLHGKKVPRLSDCLPKDWDETLFLVVDLGHCHVAFYNTARHVFLGVDLNGNVFEHYAAVDLSASGVQDKDFMSSVPPGAIFVIQPENADESSVSLYSKRSKSFIGVTREGCITSSTSVYGDGDLSLQVALIMESWRLDNVGHRERLQLPRANTIQQCFEIFEAWAKGLDSFPGKYDGNLVATAREITVVGDIGLPRTELHFRPGKKDSWIRVGKLGTINDLATGNVVVLHNKELNRDLEINQGHVGAKPPEDRYSTEITRLAWQNGHYHVSDLYPSDTNYPLLVIGLGRNRIAFYHVHSEEFLVMKPNSSVVGVQARKFLRHSDVSDELFLNQIPEGAVFVMNTVRSDHSAVSFYSEKLGRSLTVNNDRLEGSSDGPGPSQMFHIIVLMNIERFGEGSHKGFDAV
jgi:hypothetical protein